MSKVCGKCKIPKDLEEFHKHKDAKDGKQSRCKPCTKAYRAELGRKWKKEKTRLVDWIIKRYGDTPCMDCDGVFEWCAMDFDHRPGEVKEFKIGAYSAAKATITLIVRTNKEIAKCDLVCSNCHRVRTRDRHNDRT